MGGLDGESLHLPDLPIGSQLLYLSVYLMPLPYPIQLPFSLKSKHPFTSLGPDGLLLIHVPKYSLTLPVLAQDSHFLPAECGP